MLTQFDFDSIDEYQLEITSYCNAACPQCPRNDQGMGINPHMPLAHLERHVIDKTFTSALCKRLRQIFFCGSYGDPIMHPNFLDILRDFRVKNPTLWLYVHTNGGVHDSAYWREVAMIMDGYGQVDFGIDGLVDTLHLYRQNVDFAQVMANAAAFIRSGGRAQWNFIVFEHNQHQLDAARELSHKMGFHDFLARRTGRFMDHSNLTELAEWLVKGPKQQYLLRPTSDYLQQNRSMTSLPKLKKQFPIIREYFDTTEITCDALLGHKVAINVEGLVLPCNFFNHNLYDKRFYEHDALPRANQLSFSGGQNHVRKFLESYGLDAFNIKHRSLEDIFQVKMWQDLVDSFLKDLDHGRLFECAMTCGKQLTKVWDQGGNAR